jgi:hypothetical protein
VSSRFPWHIALRSQFSICANGRLFPLGKPADEAEAWGILEANQYDILLHHHDAGHTMPPVPPGAVRLRSARAYALPPTSPQTTSHCLWALRPRPTYPPTRPPTHTHT